MKALLAGAFGLCAAICAPALAAPLEAYGDIPTLGNVAISPDGTKIAFDTLVENKRNLIVYSLETRSVVSGGPIGEAKLRDIQWADNTHLITTISETRKIMELSGGRREWSLGQSIDTKTGKILNFNPGRDDTMNAIADTPLARVIDGHVVAVLKGQQFKHNQGEWMLFAQDLETGRSRFIEERSPNAEDWVVNAKGVAIAESNYREFSKRWSIRLKRDRSWEEVFATEAPVDLPSLIGLSADETSVIVATMEDGHSVFRALDIASGKMGEPMEGYGRFNSFIIDPGTSRVIGGVDIGTTHEYVFFNKDDQAIWDKVVAFFPNANVEYESWSADHKKIVVHVSGPLDGDMYRIVDLTLGQVFPVGPVYAGIAFEDVAPVQIMTYKAADGLELRAFLTLPKNRAAKNLPLIVLPHGGPAARDYPGFDWWSQALASRGYAVLQPQFRGSAGWGSKLETSGYGEFGRKMQSDLSDGVRALATKGLIDPKRVCIAGASYGGYAALAGPTLDPGIYRCAVSIAGIGDLSRFLTWEQTQSGGRGVVSRYWDRFLGVAGANDHKLDEISPIQHVDKVNVPILLIHGKDDTVVPMRQSEVMLDALKDAGKPVEFVELKSEDHWLSRSETRKQMLKATVEFLEKHNPPN